LNQLEHLNIQERNDDVRYIIDRIKIAFGALEQCKSANGVDAVPANSGNIVIKIMQTSSVPEFNKVFESYENSTAWIPYHDSADGTFEPGPSMRPKWQAVVRMAEDKYNQLQHDGLWNGVKAKRNETAFIAAFDANLLSGFTAFANFTKKELQKHPICFNCGQSGHRHAKCPEKDKDPERIKANEAKFKAKKESLNPNKGKSGKGGRSKRTPQGKWAPPTAAEKANNNRRIIDGAWHYYFEKKKRWKPCTPEQLAKNPPPQGAMVGANNAPAPSSAPAAGQVVPPVIQPFQGGVSVSTIPSNIPPYTTDEFWDMVSYVSHNDNRTYQQRKAKHNFL
jgi:hypothetical protein